MNNMKKKTITIFLFILTVTGHAQILKTHKTNNRTATELSLNSTYNYEGNSSYNSIFFKTDESGFKERPETGKSVGQIIPTGDGVNILVAYSVIFGLVKFAYIRKKKNKHS